MARRVAVATCVLAVLVLFALPVYAHPSDFETLTIDLQFRPEGLELIDAAVVESSGPSYQPGPTEELKEEVAQRVIEALNVETTPVEIDLENSELYHSVGFTIRFLDPSLSGRQTLEIDSQPLQDIAADVGLKYLKLTIRTWNHGICDGGCENWRLTPDEDPVSTTIRLQLPLTGFNIQHAMTLTLVLLMAGLSLVAVSRRRSTDPGR